MLVNSICTYVEYFIRNSNCTNFRFLNDVIQIIEEVRARATMVVVFFALRQQIGDMDCGKMRKQTCFIWLRIFLFCFYTHTGISILFHVVSCPHLKCFQ